jgi:hypothetical protein
VTPYEVVAVFALVLAAWELGRRAATRSSRSTLVAANSVMEAAKATSAMAARTARVSEAADQMQVLSEKLLAEMTQNREATETLIEMVKAELIAEVTQSRNKAREAVPERVVLPSGQSLWGAPTTSPVEPISDAPTREPDRPT